MWILAWFTPFMVLAATLTSGLFAGLLTKLLLLPLGRKTPFLAIIFGAIAASQIGVNIAEYVDPDSFQTLCLLSSGISALGTAIVATYCSK